MSDRIAEIRARLDAVGPEWIVSATSIRELMEDARWMIQHVSLGYRNSEQGERAEALLAWFDAHPPVAGGGIAIYRVRDLVNDARWLLAAIDDDAAPRRTLSRSFKTAAERNAALWKLRNRDA